MGWRTKLAGAIVLGAGIGVGVVYLKDYRVQSQPGDVGSGSYAESVAFRVDTGQPIQLRLSRCDLGMTRRRVILKVYGQVTNLGQTEIPRRQYSFLALDGHGRLYPDQSPVETSEANTFALLPAEKQNFLFKYVLDPISLQSSIELASLSETGQTNRLVRIKSPDPLDLTMAEGEWHSFHGARW